MAREASPQSTESGDGLKDSDLGSVDSHNPQIDGLPRLKRLVWEGLIATGVLFGLFAILLGDAVFLGRALLPVDFVYTFDPLWADTPPPGFMGTSNPLLSDVVDQFFPWRAYIYYWLARGELPLWNTGILAGNSFVGNGQSALFYPIQAIAYLLPLTSSFAFTAIIRLLVAALSTYGYLRLIGRSVPAAYLGAITFSLSGFIIVWLGHYISNVVIWLPMLLIALEVLFRTRKMRWVGCLALVTGVQLLGAHPETSFQTQLIAGLYAVFLAGRTWLTNGPVAATGRLAQAGFGVVLGIGLGSLQVLPFLEQLARSGFAGERAGMYGSYVFFHPTV
ncbi:MAG TPA: YfhO family protein [Dehalococcoidia bacterium]|nr:YfhO family protein [Dehalococcoidia bacterium]